jgi:quercetin dioxygenase-like cupin family protein
MYHGRAKSRLAGEAWHDSSAEARPTTGSLDVNRAPDDRPVVVPGPQVPTLQRLVDRASGSDAVTVLIDTFTSGEAVPEHTHEVEEVLLVTAGVCSVTVDGQPEAARAGDVVIIKPGISHAISHNDDEPCT